MSVKLGQTSIGSIYLGSTKIGQAYLGTTKVYDSGSSPAPSTFVQTTPTGTMTWDYPLAWPVFNGDSPTRVDLVITSSNSRLKVDFITVNTSTSAATIYGYYDRSAGSASSNVDFGIISGWGVQLHLDVSAIARDLSSGDTTMKLDIYTSDYNPIQLTFDSAACGYWK